MRLCPSCRTTKPLSAFAVNRYRCDGVNCYCRECMRERRARYAEKQRAYDAARYASKAEEIKERVRAYHADKRAGRRRLRPSWREAHAQAMAFRQAHADELAARMRAENARWKALNPDLVAAGHRRWYERHRDEILTRRAQWKEENPERYAASRRERQARRRALEAGAEIILPIDLHCIGEASAWLCHLCGHKIEKMSGADPDSLSWDHIIPLFLGGPHAADNIAPSHMRCNLRRPRVRLDEAALAKLARVA